MLSAGSGLGDALPSVGRHNDVTLAVFFVTSLFFNFQFPHHVIFIIMAPKVGRCAGLWFGEER